MKKGIFNFAVAVLIISILMAFFYVNAKISREYNGKEIVVKESFLMDYFRDTKISDTAKMIIPYTNKRGENFEIIFEPENGHLFLRTRDYSWSYDNFFYFNDLTKEVSNFFIYKRSPLGLTGFDIAIGHKGDYPYWEPERLSKREDVFGSDLIYFADACLIDSTFYIYGMSKSEVDSAYSNSYPYIDNIVIGRDDLRRVANFIKRRGCESHHYSIIEDFDGKFFEFFFYDGCSNCYQFFSDGYSSSEGFYLTARFSKTVFEEMEKSFPFDYPDPPSFDFYLSTGPRGLSVYSRNFKDAYLKHKIALLGINRLLEIIEEEF